MGTRYINSQTEHDKVVEASASTYSQLTQQGYQVTTNPGNQHNRYVGVDPQLFPDVIVWKPDQTNPNKGQAIIIEEIETSETVNQNEVDQWRGFAALGVSKFILIVPANNASEAHRLVQLNNIRVTEIWYYTIQNNQVYFTKYISLT
jgi:hypothetical protein